MRLSTIMLPADEAAELAEEGEPRLPQPALTFPGGAGVAMPFIISVTEVSTPPTSTTPVRRSSVPGAWEEPGPPGLAGVLPGERLEPLPRQPPGECGGPPG